MLAGEKARFGEPIRFDLSGLGIRSTERRAERAYVIVAEARDDCPAFQLFL